MRPADWRGVVADLAAVNHWGLNEIERIPWSRLLVYRGLAVERAKLLLGAAAR